MCESVGVRAYDLCIKTENCGATTTSRHISFLCSPEKVSVYFIIKKLPNLITAKLCVESSKISILGSANTLGSFFVGCFALLIRRLSLCMNCHCHSFACCVWRKKLAGIFFALPSDNSNANRFVEWNVSLTYCEIESNRYRRKQICASNFDMYWIEHFSATKQRTEEEIYAKR